MQAVFCDSVYQGTASGHKVIKQGGLTGIPIFNVENACPNSSSAFRLSYQEVAAEIYDIVLVLGLEKNPPHPIPSTAFHSWELELGFNFHPANYALEILKYMKNTGATTEDISLISANKRRHVSLNPIARFQTLVTLGEVMNPRQVALPLRLLHCCSLADGAAALLCSQNRLESLIRAIDVKASFLASASYKEKYIPSEIVGSIGSLLVKTEGGLMGRGHPMGANGLAQIIEIVYQLRGEAGSRLVENAKVVLAHSMGTGPNSTVTILVK